MHVYIRVFIRLFVRRLAFQTVPKTLIRPCADSRQYYKYHLGIFQLLII